MHFRLFLILILTGMLPLLIADMIVFHTYHKSEVEGTMRNMENEAEVLAGRLAASDYFNGEDNEVSDALISQLAETWYGRIRIVDGEFKVITDTEHQDVGRYLAADLVLGAFDGETRETYDLESHTMAFAAPVASRDDEEEIIGVIVFDADTSYIEEPIRNERVHVRILEIIIFCILLLADALLVFLVLRPLKTLAESISNSVNGGLMNTTVNVRKYRETTRISEAFNKTLKRMQDLDETRQDFVSNVAHELKTPMASIRVLADTLMSMEDAPAEMYQEFMTDISSEIDRESKIIDDLLSLARLDRQADELNIERSSINDMMELVLKRLTPIAQTRNIELLLESYRPVMAEVDETKLTLAVTNLVENAIKYNRDDGWVKVSLNSDYQYFYIKVTDCGCGIPEDALDHVFDRFYRVDKARSRETGGTGLGLAISQSIVALHHGQIKVYSKVNEGTTFVVRIPLKYIPAGEAR